MALPRRPLPLLLLAAALLTHITVACARERPPVGRALVDTFAVHDLNAQLLEAVELHPRTLAGETVVGRALGPLTLDGQTAAWVDPEVGIRLIDLASPGTRQAEPRPLAVLVPRQRPGACVVLQGAVVVQSAEGPFALELFLQDPEDPASWSWAGAVQRGHYAAIHAAGPQRVLAWDQADNALDLWVVDRGRGTLSPAWHWPLPEPTEALAVDGEYLALAVHGTTFDVGGRPRTGSGVALYGLDADPAGPVLYDRWKSPHDDPGLGLLWYGRGLVATQPQALHLLQRDQRSLLQPLGALPVKEPLAPLQASGRYVWLQGAKGVRVVDLRDPRKLQMLPGHQDPVSGGLPFVVLRHLLWYLDPSGHQVDGDAIPPLQVGTGDTIQRPSPSVALRAAALTHRGKPAPERRSPSVGFPQSLATYRGHLLATQGVEGVALYRLGPDPVRPLDGATYLRHLRLGGQVQRIALQDHWAFLTNSQKGFQVLDLRNPAEPLVLPPSRVDSSREGRGLLDIDGGRFLAASDALAVGRITQPGVFHIDERIDLPAPAQGLTTAASKVYVSCGHGGLLILNITAGRTPVILNHLRTNHAWGPIAVQGGRLYAVRDGTQVAVLDVTKSTSPDVLQVQEVGAAITALAVDGDRLLVGLRGAPPYGALRTYRIDGDGSLRWTGSRLLPGPPTAFAPREGPQAGLVAWGSESGEAGIEAVRPESDAAITIVGPLDVPPAPGPWLAQGTRFWTSTSNAVTIRDASHPGFPEVASSRFADQGSGIALQGLDLHTVNGSALAVLGRRWVHLQPRPDGAIATDPWPLGATEEVLAAGGDQVLVWERDALRYAVHRLQPGGSPVQVTEWVGTYPQGGGPWEVAGGAVDPGGDRFATAEQFAGATLFEAGQVVQRVDGLRATAVAIGPNRRWAAAGDRTIPGEPVQAEVHFLSPDAPAVVHAIPGVPDRLLLPTPGVALVQWAGGLTLVTASEGVIETFPGALESAQLGVGWEGGTGEVIVRFKGQLEWWVLQVRPGAL